MSTEAIKTRFVAPAQRFSYADDTAMIRIGNSLEETAALVAMEVEKLIQWGAENGVTFDHSKETDSSSKWSED
ncbi:hypothetical protein BHE90_017811, partial [Fusarium euwallaceae]